MTVCHESELEFPGCKNRKVQANFNGGNITSLKLRTSPIFEVV